MNASEIDPVELRIRIDWNHLYNDKYYLNGFAVTLTSPVKIHTSYLLSFHVFAPSTLYDDKNYEVLLPTLLVHDDLQLSLSLRASCGTVQHAHLPPKRGGGHGNG